MVFSASQTTQPLAMLGSPSREVPHRPMTSPESTDIGGIITYGPKERDAQHALWPERKSGLFPADAVATAARRVMATEC
ncbi:hypothetical protein C2857_003564 [Epichloe festucae Fl1]|uniref:Uncharacterized protein n=1 Tax=Epichloe festucae (strain Fl1) TaxID=877507 RepID=A0A7S9KNV5_EPIFF|nr:hypothetical protein C2857_003564 [Epichloe festucae Fl1]